MVICDAAADRIIAVRHSDYRAGTAHDGFTQGSIDWHYGTPDTTDPGTFQNDVLDHPSDAWPGSSGYTWIADTGNNRVIAVDPSTGDQIMQFGPTSDTPRPSSLDAPVAVGDFRDGRLVVADAGDAGSGRIVTIGTTALTNGTNDHYGDNAQTVRLDCGRPGMHKEFLTLSWVTTLQPWTSVDMAISIDGGAPLELQQRGSGTATAVTVPAGTVGKTIAFVATLRTSDRMFFPILQGITVTYRKWTGKAAGGSGGPSSTKTKGGPGTTGQSGSAASGGAGSGSGQRQRHRLGQRRRWAGHRQLRCRSRARRRRLAGASAQRLRCHGRRRRSGHGHARRHGRRGRYSRGGGRPPVPRGCRRWPRPRCLSARSTLPAPLLARRRLRRLARFDHDAADRVPFE